MIRRLLLRMVTLYQRWLSPLKRRPSCRFLPTCSEFAREAIEVHGAWRGGRMAAWRLLRCQPLGRPGYDPVRPRGGQCGGRASGDPAAEGTT